MTTRSMITTTTTIITAVMLLVLLSQVLLLQLPRPRAPAMLGKLTAGRPEACHPDTPNASFTGGPELFQAFLMKDNAVEGLGFKV